MNEILRLRALVAHATYYYHGRLLSKAGASARRYLAARGVTDADIHRFNLGYAPGGVEKFISDTSADPWFAIEAGFLSCRVDGSLRESFAGRIIFPIWNARGEPIAIAGRALGSRLPKYRNSPTSAIYKKHSTLYGLHLANFAMRRTGRAVIVEGYLDVIACHRVGIADAAAVGGTAITSSHLSQLAPVSEIVVCLDGDPAGVQAGLSLAGLAAGATQRLSVATLHPGADPASLAQDSPDVLREAIESAEPYVVWLARQRGVGLERAFIEDRVRCAQETLTELSRWADRGDLEAAVDALARETELDSALLMRAWDRIVGGGTRHWRSPLPSPHFAATAR